MGDFTAKYNYDVYNEYYTPANEWEKIKHLIPKDKIIYEAFMLNADKSTSIETWKNWGYEVVGDTKHNFLTDETPKYDILISNPPFETKLKLKILEKLMDLDKPFIIILNVMSIFSNYWREIMNNKEIQIIFPRGKIHYQRDGEKVEKKTSFYSCFVAYKFNLKTEQLYLS